MLLVERVAERLAGARVLAASTAEEGERLAREEGVDAVLLDLRLPDRPGLELLRALRADPATAGLPVFVLSGDASPEREREARAAGAAGYLTKPVELDRLAAVLEGAS
ncbi:MAG TPA: response regulator [Gaiellaceae bacterium]|nr:response regulator [Gaiellaceae bacterium]